MNPILKWPLTVIFMVVWFIGFVLIAVAMACMAFTMHANGTEGVLDTVDNVLNAWVGVMEWWRML